MSQERRLYPWIEIGNTPEKSGIYAWYYRHLLTDHDINKLILNLQAIKGNEEQESILVRNFLKTFLFDVFQEEPYHVVMRGPLKPMYEGSVPHHLSITDGLVRRIATDPKRLWILKKVLEDAVPEFASPIYIGMAVNIQNRVGQHKHLIQKYKTEPNFGLPEEATSDEEVADHSFAREVVRRGFSLSHLIVSVRVIESVQKVHLDAENILNRINFPLCGRN